MDIREAYNEWAAQYDSNQNRTRDLEKQVAKTYYSTTPMRNVLELGCGTGLNTALLKNKAKTITAIDFSANMLELAKARVSSSQVQFEEMDLQTEWPFEAGQFDFVSSSLVLEHIEDLLPIFQKCNAVLNKDGHFYICEYHPVKQFSGSKPRFELNNKTQEVDAFLHRFTDYVSAANKSGFEMVRFDNHFDPEPKAGAEQIPRLISFLFKKP